jgi:hypothetical protein
MEFADPTSAVMRAFYANLLILQDLGKEIVTT